MKNTLMLTSASESYMPLLNMTLPIFMEYADRHNIDFHFVRHPIDPPPHLDRITMWREALLTHEWLFFMGADAFITNLAISPVEFTNINADFVCCTDNNGLNNDVWFMRNCPATIKMLDWMIDNIAMAASDQELMQMYLSQAACFADFQAQVPLISKDYLYCRPELRFKLATVLNRTDVRVAILPQRELNAYPFVEYGHGMTGNEPDSWHRGDFILHHPGIELAHRIAVWPKYIAQVVR
jgi:hypothetical protein